MYTLPIDQHSTALVTGATGFVGRALVHELSALGCRIKVLARQASMANTLASNYRAELVNGDILSAASVRQACQGVTHVFHLAGRGQSSTKTMGSAKATTETHRVNVEGTKLLATAAAQEKSLERFVHLSTIAVHGHIADGPADESAPFRAESNYEISKLAAESWLNAFAKESGLPFTVLRPCAIVGPGDQRLLKLFKLGKQKFIPLLGDGSNRYQIIHVDDCVRVILAAAQTPLAKGKTYICGNAETLSLRQILELLNSAEKTEKARVVALPLKSVKTVVGATEKLCTKFGVSSPITTARLAFFEHSHWFDTTKMQNDLNVELHHDNASALLTTREWYAANGLL